jgi:histidine ammonia-lyase
VAVPTFLAWRKEAEAGRCLEAGLACLAVVASQAFHVTGREPPQRLKPLLDQIRECFPPMAGQRAPGPEAARVQALITGKVFS